MVRQLIKSALPRLYRRNSVDSNGKPFHRLKTQKRQFLLGRRKQKAYPSVHLQRPPLSLRRHLGRVIPGSRQVSSYGRAASIHRETMDQRRAVCSFCTVTIGAVGPVSETKTLSSSTWFLPPMTVEALCSPESSAEASAFCASAWMSSLSSSSTSSSFRLHTRTRRTLPKLGSW